jgi:hypothetical protein
MNIRRTAIVVLSVDEWTKLTYLTFKSGRADSWQGAAGRQVIFEE